MCQQRGGALLILYATDTDQQYKHPEDELQAACQLYWQTITVEALSWYREQDEDEEDGAAYPPPVMRVTYPRDFGRQRKGQPVSQQPETLV